MADLYSIIQTLVGPKKKRLTDNGDGTYSEAVALATRLDSANDAVNIGAIGGQVPLLELSILTSSARTSTYTGSTQFNTGSRGVQLYLDVTAVPGTDTVQLIIDELDPVSLKWSAMFTTTAVAATGTYKYMLYPGTGSNTGLTATAQKPLGRSWRVRVVHSAATSFTYSVGGVYLP